jgi:hypothetical protein
MRFRPWADEEADHPISGATTGGGEAFAECFRRETDHDIAPKQPFINY